MRTTRDGTIVCSLLDTYWSEYSMKILSSNPSRYKTIMTSAKLKYTKKN